MTTPRRYERGDAEVQRASAGLEDTQHAERSTTTGFDAITDHGVGSESSNPLWQKVKGIIDDRGLIYSSGRWAGTPVWKVVQNSLLVQDRDTDPYVIGYKEAHHNAAKWVSDLLSGVTEEIHPRDVYYSALGMDTPKDADAPAGATIIPSDNFAKWIRRIIVWAKWLGYPLPPIKDEKTGPPTLRAFDMPDGWITEAGLEVDIADPLPEPYINLDGKQPRLHLIFAEKSGLEKLVKEVADPRRVSYLISEGDASLIYIERIAEWAVEDGRELVIHGICDADPGGWNMLVAIARKLQALKDRRLPDLRFQVWRFGLTPAQAKYWDSTARFDLSPGDPYKPMPLAPVKAGAGKDRKDNWTRTMGIGQIEVNALVSPLFPERRVWFKGLLEAWLDEWMDSTLNDRVTKAEQDWLKEAQEAIDTAYADVSDEVEEKVTKIRALIDEINHLIEDVEVELPTAPETRVGVEPPPGPKRSAHQPLLSSDLDYETATQRLLDDRDYRNGDGWM